MGGAYHAAGLIDDVHDGKKVLDAADTLDDIGDASKVLDSVTDGADAGDITRYVYKGDEVSPDLKVEARILDEDGKLVEEISGQERRLSTIVKETNTFTDHINDAGNKIRIPK